MKTALIGHTGFVGSNLSKQYAFSDKYNSSNISEIKNKNYDIVVCSGISASMWNANNFPEKDLENINSLLNNLKTIDTNKFILISSTAVFSQPVKNVNEDSSSFEEKVPYGRNRKYAENFIVDNFTGSLIIRLPALFGGNLQKNFIYDLLNQEPAFLPKIKFENIISLLSKDEQKLLEKYYNFEPKKHIYEFDKNAAINENKRNSVLAILRNVDCTALEFTHSESFFQYYNLDNLWKDIKIALDHNLDYLHLCSEPIQAKEVSQKILSIPFDNDNGNTPFDYDMKTKYASFWGKKGNYQYSKEEVLKDLQLFVNTQMEVTR